MALLGRYAELLASGIPAAGPGYLWRYAWRHAAAAGPPGLELIRGLAAAESELLPDVALADQEVADRLRGWGYRLEAVAPAEEAAQLYRELTAANPAFLPDLASALNNLGTRYSEVGRQADALPPTEEAVQLRRELAAANPAFLPDLAGTLSNLGVLYSGVGRRADALPPAEEALRLYRELAADQSRLPAIPRHGADQPRQSLQRDGTVGRRPAPGRGSPPPLPGTRRGQPRLPARTSPAR